MFNDIIKVKDKVKWILKTFPATRNSDKELFSAWYVQDDELEPTGTFLDAVLIMPAFESITRARREIQKECPELRSDKQIKRARDREEKLIEQRYMRR